MKRVYDDTQYEYAANRIMDVISTINPSEVSKYDYGCYRAKYYLIQRKIEESCSSFVFRNVPCTHGIGNNQVREIIYAPDGFIEEQVCGLLHMTDDMFGREICYCTDIDGNRSTKHITIEGRE